MTGNIKGFVTLAEIKNPLIVKIYWFIYREVLMTKALGNEFNFILINAIRIVNYNKKTFEKPFIQTCKSMDAGL